jgi:ATP-binding cassette, subfamily B, beta-glucan exporter
MSLLQIYWRALQYLAAYRLKVGVVVVANIILAVITIAEPVLFGWIIDAISTGKPVTDILIMWGGFGVFNTVAFVLVAREADRLAHGRRATLLTEAFGRIISMPLSWHHQRGTSNALHTLLRASETLFGLWLEFMRTHLATIVALALLIPTALSMDVRLTVVLIVLGLVYMLIGKVVMDKTKDGQASVEGHYHTVFSHVSDSISNVSVVHSYNRIQAETAALQKFTTNLINAQYPVLDWWAIASGLNRIASTASMLIILILGTMLVQKGELRVGDVIAFIGFANLLIGRLDQMRQFSTQIFEARAKLEDFYQLEDSVKERDEPAGTLDLPPVRGDVEFKDVSFDFANTTQGVKHVSF